MATTVIFPFDIGDTVYFLKDTGNDRYRIENDTVVSISCTLRALQEEEVQTALVTIDEPNTTADLFYTLADEGYIAAHRVYGSVEDLKDNLPEEG